MEYVNNERLDMEIKKNVIKEKCSEATWEYHNNLLELLDAKTNSDGKGGNTLDELYRNVNANFSKIVSLQSHMISLSFNIAKITLQEAFDRCGFEYDENGTLTTPSSRTEKGNE